MQLRPFVKTHVQARGMHMQLLATPPHFFFVFVFLQMALRGIKVIEMAGLAPAPLAGMILAGGILNRLNVS